MRESSIERHCCEIAKAAGIEHIKLDRAKRNWPDRMFAFPDRPWFVEFKRPGEAPRRGQQRLHERLLEQGYDLSVIDDVEAFRRAFRSRLHRAPSPRRS